MAVASREQASGIEQLNRAILQIEQVTQQNAALVEETAAASQSMGEQAARLRELMRFFKLHDEPAVTATPTAEHQHERSGSALASPVVAIERHHHLLQSRRNVAKMHHASSRSRHAVHQPRRAVNGGKERENF